MQEGFEPLRAMIQDGPSTESDKRAENYCEKAAIFSGGQEVVTPVFGFITRTKQLHQYEAS